MALDTNLVSYWKFDESSGNAVDSVGSNDGTNSSVTFTSGKINNCAYFDAATDKFSCTSTGMPTGSGARTIAGWINIKSSGNNNVLLAMYGSGAGAGRMFAFGAATNALYFYGIAADVTSSATFNTDTWYHIAVTYDGTTVRIYQNATELNNGTPSLNTDSSTTFTMGDDNGTWAGTGSIGYIDEVGIWSRELSSTEISELYNSGDGLAYPFTTDYPMTADVGTFTLTGQAVTFDSGLTANKGTFTLTGIAATLRMGFKLIADAGSFILSGQAVSFATKMVTAVGTFTLTGIDAALRQGYKMIAETGSFILTFINIKTSYWLKRTKPSTTFTKRTKPSTSFSKRTKPSTTWTKRY